MFIILILASFLITKLILPIVVSLLIKGGAVRENYLGKKIPIGTGLVIWLVVTPLLIVYGILVRNMDYFLFNLILTVTLLIGLIDDLTGDHNVKGLKGHFLQLLTNQELTSGALKAFIISLFSFLTSWALTSNIIDGLINFFLLILTTNSFNLFDLRPGRAVKMYFFLAVIIIIFYPNSRIFLGVFLASLLSYALWDLKGKVMLGDAGANFLGMSLGLVMVTNLSQGWKIVMVILLTYLHYYSEKKSLSVLIEKLPLLRFIDNLGR